MSKWRKVTSIALAAVMAFSLTACGTGKQAAEAPKTENKQATEQPAEKVKLIYARGKDVTGATEKIVEAFEKKYPNIDVEFREMPADTGQSHDQYVTMFSAKSSEIDVFDLDVIWPAEFAQAGYLLPLDRFIEKDQIDMSKYIKGAVEAGNYNGQQWTMPKFIDTGLLYYRKDIVKQPPKTWDELIAQARQYKGKGGTQFGYLMQAKQYEGLVCNFVEFNAAYGGKILDENGNVVINNPNSIKALKKMMEIVKSDIVPRNITTFTELESHTAFIEGQAPFIRNWPYMYALAQDKTQSKVVDKVAIAPLPAGDAGSAATLGGWMTGINKYTKHPKEAWEFVKFMTGPEGQKITAIYGGSAPTLLPVYDDPEVQKASPLFANKDFINGVSAAVPRPSSPIYPKISEIIQIEVSKALAGQQTAEQAVQNMEKKMKEAIGK
ncbi:ABC transporter substrate-binding protein [Carboxydocella sp. JDF658]|uniref:ABC transporter substrate-binding protein n=1 Tax=Carboxydocella sp. JDF658 TaxID=1926600 RepID=UPI0009AE1780|nr:ABC transporter substrate-binding protein [Carboxydocella sp. JDF658]AVX29978.1 carbohydrate ABC transporter substrate-binding protein, CUT1 family [Carboxydocella thermautotrophica]GAW31217.1 ABC transporter substrate-binding protein [Carboxydocella sp. JDF658]